MNRLKSNEEYFEFSKLLVVIPTEEIKKLLLENNIKLPFYVHNFLLRETIRGNVFDNKVFNDFTDEQKFRLRGYDKYSIFPLEKLIEKHGVEFDLGRYKELLFDFIFANMNKLGLKHDFAKDLDNLKDQYPVDLEELMYNEFYYVVKDIFYIENGYLDGMKITEYDDEDTIASYTLGDLKGLGLKYDVKVPRRINKAKLLEVLQAKFKLSDDELELIKKKSVLDLEIYAREKGFKISIDLKKRDMVEFIEFSLGMYHKPVGIDTFDYDIPVKSAEQATLEDINDETEDTIDDFIEEDVDTSPIPVEEDVEEPVVLVDEPIISQPIDDSWEEVYSEPLEVPEELDEELNQVEEVSPLEPEEGIISEPVLEEPVIVEEEISKPIIEPEPIVEPKPIIEPEPKPESLRPAKFMQAQQNGKDDSILSNEEKELLDEKINQIIKKYYKKRRNKRIIWISIISVIILIVAFAIYAYIYYVNNAILPFGIPVFW